MGDKEYVAERREVALVGQFIAWQEYQNRSWDSSF